MQISYNTCETEMPEINQERVSSWISQVVESFECEIGEINYYFCSDNYLLEMNREHLNHDYFTDIITFDYTVADMISGDLFISVDTVRDNAQEYQVDFFEELHRVIVHGVLHLLGYKDKSVEEKALMTAKENYYLSLLPKSE